MLKTYIDCQDEQDGFQNPVYPVYPVHPCENGTQNTTERIDGVTERWTHAIELQGTVPTTLATMVPVLAADRFVFR